MTMSTNFLPTYVTRYDVGHVQAGRPSCIDRRTVLATEQGPMTAEDVVRHVGAGRRVSFAHRGPDGQPISNPVQDAICTTAPGRTIRFADGRSITLTGGHVLPVAASFTDTDGWCPVGQETIILTQDVEVGDALFDGEVVEIVEHDSIEAVRLWTAIPRWITTASGLTVGTRWHEVCVGWTIADGDDEQAPYFEVVGLIRVCHRTPGAALDLAWEDSGAFAVETDDVPVMIRGAGLAATIRHTIVRRGGSLGDSAEVPPVFFEKARRKIHRVTGAPPATLGDAAPKLAAIKQAVGLQLVSSNRMDATLRGGAEVSDWAATG
jgi:hypothetical protein